MKKQLYVFDIDGTLADCSHRLHYITGKKRDYKTFYEKCREDKPIQNTINILWALRHTVEKEQFLFVTGRSEECRVETSYWLGDHVLYAKDSHILMRKEGDHREDTIVKKELLEQWLEDNSDYEVSIIFEDRTCVVDMWREAGYTCFQVAKGDY